MSRSLADIAALLTGKGVAGRVEAITPLQGGYLNDVLMAETDRGPMVIKFFGAPIEGTLFPNLPEDEARATQVLAAHDVAPRLIGFWPEEHAIVCEFIPGGTWDGDIAAVARLLWRKEAADPAGFRTVPVTPGAILAEGDALFDRAGGSSGVVRPEAIDLPPPPRLSLIHTDVGAGNLIGRGEALRLIDWQCPAAGDLTEDIYSFLSPAFQILSGRAPLDDAMQAEFWNALDGGAARDRYRRLVPFYAWRMAGYCALRAATHSDPAVRARYRDALAAEIAGNL